MKPDTSNDKINTARIIILVAAALIICGSGIVWFFTGRYFSSASSENRTKAEKPELTPDTYAEYSADYTAYFNDNMPFRDSLITFNSLLDYSLFRRSATGQVVIGKEGWLFYAKASDGAPLKSYKGSDLYTDDELAAFAENCIKQQEYIESLGKEFVLFIAPNKERIYSEYMPDDYGKPAEYYRALQIYDYLRENTDVRVIYPYAELMAAKDALSVNIWYKIDTHWNRIGSYVGARALLEELEITLPEITDPSITITETDSSNNDLAQLLGLMDVIEFTDTDYIVDGYAQNTFTTNWDGKSKNFDYFAENADPRKILIISDSFAAGMGEYIGSRFNESRFRHVDLYTSDELASYDCDIVVYETVERLLMKLARFSFTE